MTYDIEREARALAGEIAAETEGREVVPQGIVHAALRRAYRAGAEEFREQAALSFLEVGAFARHGLVESLTGRDAMICEATAAAIRALPVSDSGPECEGCAAEIPRDEHWVHIEQLGPLNYRQFPCTASRQEGDGK